MSIYTVNNVLKLYKETATIEPKCVKKYVVVNIKLAAEMSLFNYKIHRKPSTQKY